MGNHIDITLTQSGVSFNAPLHQIRFGRGSIELQHDWKCSKAQHTLVWGMNIVRKRFNNNTLVPQLRTIPVRRPCDGSREFQPATIALISCSAGFRSLPRTAGNSNSVAAHKPVGTSATLGASGRDSALNFGIRYEPYGSSQDKLDRNQTFDYAANRAGIRSKIYKNALPGLFYHGDDKPAGYGGGDTFGGTVTDPDYNNWAPRSASHGIHSKTER